MGAGPAPEWSGYGGMPPNPYGGSGYGHPGMMQGGHMHGGGYGGTFHLNPSISLSTKPCTC